MPASAAVRSSAAGIFPIVRRYTAVSPKTAVLQELPRSEIKLFHVFHIFDHHQRDLESNGILKNAQIEAGALLQRVQPLHQSVSEDKKLT